MKHNVKKKKMNKSKSHIKAIKRNMADQIVLHEKIETTIAKAKAIQPYIERLITKARAVQFNKTDKFNTIKYLRTRMFSEDAIRKLVEELGSRYQNTKGGYTRIIRIGNRDGDNTMMAAIELIEEKNGDKTEKTKKRSSRKKEIVKKSTENEALEEQKEEENDEE